MYYAHEESLQVFLADKGPATIIPLFSFGCQKHLSYLMSGDVQVAFCRQIEQQSWPAADSPKAEATSFWLTACFTQVTKPP